MKTKMTTTKEEKKVIPLEKRNKEMIVLRNSGSTLAEIGERYGLTKARVLQIVGKRSSYKRHITANSVQRTVAEFFATTRAFPSLRTIADMVDVSTSYARMMVDELAEQDKLKLTVQRGRLYITGVVPPEDLPEETRKQALERLEELKKEWRK